MTLSKSLAAFVSALALGVAGAAAAQSAPPSDPMGDVTVTKAESRAKATMLFDRLDTDHDGFITAAEEQAAAQGVSPGMARALGGMVRRADTNGDGKLAKAEFLANQGQRFDRQDTDHDGKLTKAERDAARAAMAQRRQQMRPMQDGGGFGPPEGDDGSK